MKDDTVKYLDLVTSDSLVTLAGMEDVLSSGVVIQCSLIGLILRRAQEGVCRQS